MAETRVFSQDADVLLSAPTLFSDTRKRFLATQPHLIVDSVGTIIDMSSAAERMLEMPQHKRRDTCFFTYVHGKNLYQVMRDVADMVCHNRRDAKWLLRLRTGKNRWRWFTATVERIFDADGEPMLIIQLKDM